MLKDLYNQIQKSANKADFKRLPLSNSNNAVFVLANGDCVHEDEKPIRRHRLTAIEDVQPYLDHAKDKLSAFPVIWLGNDAVHITLDDGNDSAKLDAVKLMFTHTEEFTRLLNLNGEDNAGGKVYTQTDFIRLLRVTFYDCFASNDDRLRLVAMLKSVSQKSEASNGSRSMATVSDACEWPDFFSLHMRVFDDPALQHAPPRPVRVHIEVKVGGMFELVPNSNDMNAAVQDEIAHLASILNSSCKDTPIFRGYHDTPEPRKKKADGQ